MNKVFGIAIAALLFAPSPALAAKKAAANCTDSDCKAWQKGVGSKPGQPTKCLVTIVAPTFGGKVALDVRKADRVSRWGAPRIKHVGPGEVKFRIGCGWLEEPTAEVYLCVQGKDGTEFVSIRWRAKGDFDSRTRRLEACLKGGECPKYVPGGPPE